MYSYLVEWNAKYFWHSITFEIASCRTKQRAIQPKSHELYRISFDYTIGALPILLLVFFSGPAQAKLSYRVFNELPFGKLLASSIRTSFGITHIRKTNIDRIPLIMTIS